jgi:hypothetical protein
VEKISGDFASLPANRQILSSDHKL